MLCVPKADITIPAKKHIKPRSFQGIKTVIQLQGHEDREISWFLKEVEKQNKKLEKNWTDLDLVSSRYHDKTNLKLDRSAPYPLVLTKQ